MEQWNAEGRSVAADLLCPVRDRSERLEQRLGHRGLCAHQYYLDLPQLGAVRGILSVAWSGSATYRCAFRTSPLDQSPDDPAKKTYRSCGGIRHGVPFTASATVTPATSFGGESAAGMVARECTPVCSQSAGHDRQLAGLRRPGAARYRRIHEHHAAPFRQRRRDSLRRVEFGRRMVDQDFAFAAPDRDDPVRAQRHVLDGGGVDDAHENDVAGSRNFRRAVRRSDAPIRSALVLP